MAKIKSNNFLDTVNEVFTDAKEAGVLHLYAEDESFSGRTLQMLQKLLWFMEKKISRIIFQKRNEKKSLLAYVKSGHS